MLDDSSFPDLLRRVRTGDDAAATELVRLYEPAVRRVVRFRLRPGHRRVCDSLDICQAVLADFFVRIASGQYELQTPEQLVALLATMARNAVMNEQRRQQAARRDQRRDAAVVDAERDVAPGATPSREVSARELLHEVRRRLTDEERRLMEMRDEGQDWNAIAAEMGGTPEGLRKKLARALDRVTGELGLGEVSDG